MSGDVQREDAVCPWCGRTIGVNPKGLLYKHDNRNNSGYCKGSLLPVAVVFGRQLQDGGS